MLAQDMAFLFADLHRLGLESLVEITRAERTGRNARGVSVSIETPAEEGAAVPCYLKESDELLVAAGFGGSDDHDRVALFLAGVDVQQRDVITVVSGDDEGKSFRVLRLKAYGAPGCRVATLTEVKS